MPKPTKCLWPTGKAVMLLFTCQTGSEILVVTKPKRLRELTCHFLQNKSISTLLYGSRLSDYLIPLLLHFGKAAFSNDNFAVV